jgi:hypothetical protein
MPEPQPLNERDQADLVAYLDGELAGEAARRVEKRLNLDASFRAEADSLKRSWELLDHLPRAEPSPTFTHQTIERLSRPSAAPGRGGPRRWKPWALGIGWAAALLIATYAGFASMDALAPREPGERELARELSLIENKRLYDLVDDLEFLQDLDHPDLFGEEKADS